MYQLAGSDRLFFRLGVGLLISCILVELRNSDQRILYYLLFSITILLLIFVILDHYEYFDKRSFSMITPLQVFEQNTVGAERWSNKYFASWLTLLIWATVPFLWNKDGKGKIYLTTILLFCSLFAVFKLSSSGATLANGVALLCFVLLNLIRFKKYQVIYSVIYC